MVMTFSVGNNHDIFGIYLAYDPKQQNEHVFSLCLVGWSAGSNGARKHAHLFAWDPLHAPHISHDYRDDHRQEMSRPND